MCYTSTGELLGHQPLPGDRGLPDSWDPQGGFPEAVALERTVIEERAEVPERTGIRERTEVHESTGINE
jgi:hypothetical protein